MNVFEWNEAILFASKRGRRGGSFFFLFGPTNLAASLRGSGDPSLGSHSVGIRDASPVPASPAPSLSPLGIATLLGLLGAAAYRRRCN